MHDEPLEQDAGDLLLDHLRLRLREQVEQHAAEVVRVLVGVPQLVGHGVQEEVTALGVQLVRQLPSPFSVSWHGGGTAGHGRARRSKPGEKIGKREEETEGVGTHSSSGEQEINAVLWCRGWGRNDAELENS